MTPPPGAAWAPCSRRSALCSWPRRSTTRLARSTTPTTLMPTASISASLVAARVRWSPCGKPTSNSSSTTTGSRRGQTSWAELHSSCHHGRSGTPSLRDPACVGPPSASTRRTRSRSTTACPTRCPGPRTLDRPTSASICARHLDPSPPRRSPRGGASMPSSHPSAADIGRPPPPNPRPSRPPNRPNLPRPSRRSNRPNLPGPLRLAKRPNRPRHRRPTTGRIARRASTLASRTANVRAMHLAYLGVGANLGNRLATLRAAARMIASDAWRETTVTAWSSIIETRPVGPSRYPFLNAVLEISTTLDARPLLERCLALEAAFGRVRSQRWAPRELDIDILYMSGAATIIRSDTATLTLPHPRLLERDFALLGLAELAPQLILGPRTCAEHLAALPDVERSWLRTLRDSLLPHEGVSAPFRAGSTAILGG
ncbi:MAG: 2-amino-4-hydroxy-6-hydroxymethyldihydropteridine diphosphokinase [Myxococcales bacterium FL481]|nr:MAG: 2-amino-4-hydroxy-6-hydroxymethyldihydropteridine diphosphokinase [Myxococcales bacterium FL481]